MQSHEWAKISHNPRLDVGFLHAYYVEHAYPRHSHDYYVISLIERGRQSFTHKGIKHVTPPGGVILINPGEAHTGEAADSQGFELRSLYPTISHMQMAVAELAGRERAMPFFRDVRVDHRWATNSVSSLHKAMSQSASALELESRFVWVLAGLIKRYADITLTEKEPGREKQAVSQARRYIEEHFTRGVSLNELAQHVGLSPYYLLRVFSAEVGMPPYAYLESVRVRYAQRLLENGRPLAETAIEAGYSSQSHMTRHFKKIIGATPGQYAQQMRT
jgi:AraC-like DNA-binding protein